MARRKKKRPTQQPLPAQRFYGRLWRSIGFLAGSGILVALLSATYQYFAGNVFLEFVQPIGRAYEFQFRNDTPSNKTVKSFYIDLPNKQHLVYKTTENVYAHVDDEGHVNLPEGNISYIPATEFRELNGQILLANSTLKFRVPPLSSRSWMAPEATIVDVHFEIESANPALSVIETFLEAMGLRSRIRTVRYLVVENYWTVSQSSSIDEAIRVYCRDNETTARSSNCTNWR